MCNKKILLSTTVAVVIGAGLLVITQTRGAAGNPQSSKLEGAWVLTVPGTPLLTSLVMAPTDPSGRQAVISGNIAVRIFAPPFPDSESSGPFTGEAVMTGPDMGDFTLLGYGTKRVNPMPDSVSDDQLVVIWTMRGQMQFTTAGKTAALNNVTIAYFSPDADTNGDGIPEEAPLYCLNGQALLTRVGAMPPCTP